MPKLFYMQFVVSDWRRDVAGCTAAAIGTWIQLCCAMFEAKQTGELKGTLRDLASRCGIQADEFIPALAELQAKDIGTINPEISRENPGIIYSVINRRMKRKYEQRQGWESTRTGKIQELTGQEPGEIQDLNDVQTESREGHINNSNYISSVSVSEKGGGLKALEAKWVKCSGIEMLDVQTLATAGKEIASYAARVGRPLPAVQDQALAAFARHVGKWRARQPLTPSLFLRKWEEIQAEMGGKVDDSPKAANDANPPIFDGKVKYAD